MKKLITLLCLLVSGAAFAEPVTISWEPVGLREDGSEITGTIDYVITQNGEQIAETANTVVTVEVEEKLGSTFCAYTRETNSGAATKSAGSCVTLPDSLPQAPTIKIQLVYDL